MIHLRHFPVFYIVCFQSFSGGKPPDPHFLPLPLHILQATWQLSCFCYCSALLVQRSIELGNFICTNQFSYETHDKHRQPGSSKYFLEDIMENPGKLLEVYCYVVAKLSSRHAPWCDLMLNTNAMFMYNDLA